MNSLKYLDDVSFLCIAAGLGYVVLSYLGGAAGTAALVLIIVGVAVRFLTFMISGKKQRGADPKPTETKDQPSED